MAKTTPTKPALNTLNAIRNAPKGHLEGYHVAEALDAIVDAIGQTNTAVANNKTNLTSVNETINETVQQVQATSAQVQSALAVPINPINPVVPNSDSFAALTTGDNTQMTATVDTGASLSFTGKGVINSNEIGGINVAGNVPTHPGMLLISQPGNEDAVWADPQVQGLYPAGSAIDSPPATYIAPTTIQPVLIGGSQSGVLEALKQDANGNLYVTGTNANILPATQDITHVDSAPYSLTATLSGSNSSNATMSINAWQESFIMDWDSNPVDQTATASSASSTTFGCGSITPTTGNEFVVMVVNAGGAMPAGSGPLNTATNGFTNLWSGVEADIGVFHQVLPSMAAQSTTMTFPSGATSYCACLVALRGVQRAVTGQVAISGTANVNITNTGIPFYSAASQDTNAATFNSSTALNTTLVLPLQSAADYVNNSLLVTLNQTGTISAGALTFEVSTDGTNWVTAPPAVNAVTFVAITNPYTLVSNTYTTFQFNTTNWFDFRVRLSTVITGSSTPQVVIGFNSATISAPATAPVYITNVPVVSGEVQVIGTKGAFDVLAAGSSQNTAAVQIAGVYNSSLSSISSGDGEVVQIDKYGQLLVDLNAVNGTILGAPSDYGTSPGAVPVIGVNAYITGGAVGGTQYLDGASASAGAFTGTVAMLFDSSGSLVEGMRGDSSGNLLVNVAGFAYGTALPINLTQLDGTALGAMANYGTSPGAVKVPGVNAFVTNNITVVGDAASGSPVAGNPVLVAGSDGTDARSFLTSNTGQLHVIVDSGAGGGTQYVDGTAETAGAFTGTVALSYNGTDVVGLRSDSSDNLKVNIAAQSLTAVSVSATSSANAKTNPIYVAVADGTNVSLLGFMGTAVATTIYAQPVMAGLQASVSGTQTALTGTGTSLNVNVTNTDVPVNIAQYGGNAVVSNGVNGLTGVGNYGTSNTSAAAWTSSTGVNTAVTLISNIAAYNAVTVTLNQAPTGTLTGGVVTFQASNDNSNWYNITGVDPNALATVGPVLTLGPAATYNMFLFTVPAPYFRVLLSTAITGTGTVTIGYATDSLPTVHSLAGNITGSLGAVYNSTAPTPAATATVNLQADYGGDLFVKPIRRSFTAAKPTNIASTTSATTIVSAAGSNIYADLSHLSITVLPVATTAITFTATLSDGTNSYIYCLSTGVSPATGSYPVLENFNPPLPAASTNTAWTLQLSVNTVTVNVITNAVYQKAS